MSAPTYLPFYVLAGSSGIIAALVLGLSSALAKAGWPARERVAAARATAAVLIAWLAAATVLGLAGAYRGAPDRIPTIQYGIFAPILIGVWLGRRSGTVRRLIDAVPQPWIIGVQLYRALGVIFIILLATGRLPGLFAWPAGVGDVVVGLLAPIVAVAYARRPHENGRLVSAWNLFGLADLAIAVSTGFITAPSPLFVHTPANELISRFPLVLIPVYLVPISVLLHLASLAKLRRTAVRAATPGTLAAASATR